MLSVYRLLVVASLLVVGLVSVQPFAQARAQTSPVLSIEPGPGGVQLRWRGAAGSAGFSALPTESEASNTLASHGFQTRLIPLRVAVDGAIVPEILRVESEPLHVIPAGLQALVTAVQEGDRQADQAPSETIPETPIAVVREGRLRGTRIAVVGLSPLFEQSGVIRVATHVEALIPGTSALPASLAQSVSATGAFIGAAPGPNNPIAARPAIKVRVGEAGLQRVSGAALQAAGWELAGINAHHIQAWHGGAPVALEALGSDDGLLDPSDELRFYAPEPGDRWNSTDTYWLTLEERPGLRMQRRSAASGGAPVRTSALARGIWRNNTFYDALLPGPDGDHWFAGNMQTGPGRPAATIDLIVDPGLPLAAGPSSFTVKGSAYTAGQHHLAMVVGGQSSSAQWSGRGDWQQTFSLTDSSSSAQLQLVPGTAHDGLEPDSIQWERPVELDLRLRGATFTGVSGRWRYQLANVPADARFYDIRDLRSPVVVETAGGSTRELEDGAEPVEYLVSGPGTLRTPEVSRHIPVDLVAPLDADVLYLAPAAFHAPLAPLISHRRAQGYAARGVDLQSIYDAWAFGQVSPDAIRHFLQYASATWQRVPTHVILVGDGTSDPRNYTKRNNNNFVPPYLAMVDPWLGETACETCYGQLDGPSPLSDPLPDLAVGRLPVKSAAELTALVDKLVAYETDQTVGGWRSRNVYVADNADRAGNFPALADLSAELQPSGVDVQRIYYDPSASGSGQPWREADPVRAYQRTVEALNGGAAFVNYVGHSYYWQWALTDPTATPPYLLGLYDPDKLTNGKRLPVVLEMTCYTAAFHQPAFSGTTIDERLLLNRGGGAIAVWGPTGMGVAHGHDALQRGFYRRLWAEHGAKPTLGALTTAGYLELFTTSSCCQDTLRTFALLGDPLTRPQVTAVPPLYVPFVTRSS